MGGNGTIGGGRSLKLDVDIEDNARPPVNKGKWLLEDSDVVYPFTLEFEFPRGTSIVNDKVTLTINSNRDKVKVRWWQ
jgi:hypothetical protein